MNLPSVARSRCKDLFGADGRIGLSRCWMRRRLVVATVAGLVLAACAVPPPRAPEIKAERPPGFPADFYRQSAARGHPVFEIDPALSLVVIEVYRGGSLARLGHDHAIASHNIRGYVAPEEARADLYIRLDELVVDEPELRAEAALDTQPTEAAIAGTRRNMLLMLRAEQNPYAVVSVERVEAAATGPVLNASITLNGVSSAVTIPAQIEQGNDQLMVKGRVSLGQTQFGIVPLSILGGAILVQDQVEVRFMIQARRPPS